MAGIFTSLMAFMQKISRTPANYWGEFIIDIPLGMFLFYEGLHLGNIAPAAVLLTGLAGLLFFSLLEYIVHRRVFHGSIMFIVKSHQLHHEAPLGYDGVPFFLPALLLTILIGLFSLFLPLNYTLLLAAAIDCGYVCYGLGHFLIHHHHFRNRQAQRWASHHLIHHFHPETNFGVTTPLWDKILLTRYIHSR